MKNLRFKSLLERYFHGSLSPGEWKVLVKYLRKKEFQRRLRREIEQALHNDKFKDFAEESRADKLFQSIMDIAAKKENIEETKTYKINWLKTAIAASTIIIFSAGSWVWYNHSLHKETLLVADNNKTDKNDVLPGGNKATLTLANGHVISLDSTGNGAVARQGATQIMKQNGNLLYSNQGKNKQGKILYNIVSTPRGGQYRLVLPDGTRVWLNAASSLKFPTAFTATERNVTLTGEAYFEVAEDEAKPFKVNVGAMQVEVLGTHFDIMAYKDEAAINTTLLEGSVKINTIKGEVLLKPGQQAEMNNKSEDIKVTTADTEKAVAWKNGLFVFNNTGIKEIMRQLARWYDVKVDYEGNINGRLNGMISRYTNLSEVLKMLELTREAHFRIEESRIIVSP